MTAALRDEPRAVPPLPAEARSSLKLKVPISPLHMQQRSKETPTKGETSCAALPGATEAHADLNEGVPIAPLTTLAAEGMTALEEVMGSPPESASAPGESCTASESMVPMEEAMGSPPEPAKHRHGEGTSSSPR